MGFLTGSWTQRPGLFRIISMKSKQPGRSTSKVELTNVSPHGMWLLIGDREYFLSFKHFPWFERASIRDLARVELPSPHHLVWPALDIDIAVESIEHPERYPLLSQSPPDPPPQPSRVENNSRIRRAPVAARN
jgi:hypothetical protein